MTASSTVEKNHPYEQVHSMAASERDRNWDTTPLGLHSIKPHYVGTQKGTRCVFHTSVRVTVGRSLGYYQPRLPVKPPITPRPPDTTSHHIPLASNTYNIPRYLKIHP